MLSMTSQRLQASPLLLVIQDALHSQYNALAKTQLNKAHRQLFYNTINILLARDLRTIAQLRKRHSQALIVHKKLQYLDSTSRVGCIISVYVDPSAVHAMLWLSFSPRTLC